MSTIYSPDGTTEEVEDVCIEDMPKQEVIDEYYLLQEEYYELEDEYEDYKSMYEYSEDYISEIKSEYESQIESLKEQITQLEYEVNEKEVIVEDNNSLLSIFIVGIFIIFIVVALIGNR